MTDGPEIKYHDLHLLGLLGKFEDKLNLWEYLVCWVLYVVATLDHQAQTPCIKTNHYCLE